MVIKLLQNVCRFFVHFNSGMYLTLVVLLSLSACTSLSSRPQITYLDRDSLNFTGRGSAAGVMLDSVMNGAGIAIGIAIDQGIAKDISNNILRNNPRFDFRELVRQRLEKSAITGVDSIIIKTYGFKSAPGEDRVSAWIDLDIIHNGKSIQIKYPEDFTGVETEKFIAVKEDSAVAADLLVQALDRTFPLFYLRTRQ
jgi:hypothetical protein